MQRQKVLLPGGGSLARARWLPSWASLRGWLPVVSLPMVAKPPATGWHPCRDVGGLTVVGKRGRVRGNDQHTQAKEMKPESQQWNCECAGRTVAFGQRKHNVWVTPFI